MDASALAADVLEASTPCAVLDDQARYVYVNHGYEQLTGKPRAELLGRVMWEVFPAAASPDLKFWSAHQLVRHERAPAVFEEHYPPMDLWVEVELYPVSNANIAAFYRRINPRKKAEAQLRDSEARFRVLAETMPQLVWIIRVDGTVDYVNQHWRDYTGLTPEQEVSWAELIHPDDRAESVRRWQAALQSNQPYSTEYRLRCARDGSYRWFLAQSLPVREDGGRIVRWLGTATDVQDLKDAEQAARESEARLRHFLDHAPAAVAVFDRDMRYLAVSRRYLQDYRLGQLDIIGRSQYEIFPEIPERWREIHRRCLEGRVEQADEDTLPRSDGTVDWVRWEIRPWYLGSGEVGGLILFSEIITERKQAEAALQAANEGLRELDQRKNEFLAMLSHELRNPLAPIRNSVYILERAAPGGEQARRAREVIDRQAQHLSRLVDDLLDVTRISRGKIRLQREVIDLQKVVRGVAEDHRDQFARTGVDLQVQVTEHPVRVFGDATRLAQAVGNLLNNSAKFTSPGGRTTVVLESEPNAAVIRVRDTGVGISPEVLPRLFEPFVQGDRTLDRSRGGLGLGLALVKGLAELHGGTVGASSPGLGHGAEFFIRLPLHEPDARATASPSSPERESRGRRVLIIEDNLDAAESLKEVIEFAGHTVAVAPSGLEGIALARRFDPDLVLCDIGLPGMDGYDVARAFRDDASLGRIVLVALTGYASPEDRQRAIDAGFDTHLAKPADLGQLESILSRMRE